MSSNLVKIDGDVCRLAGEVDFSTAPEIFSVVSDHIERVGLNGSIVIDFSDVTRANSVALALLLAWQEKAAEKPCVLSHQNLPESIRQLSDICQVSSFI